MGDTGCVYTYEPPMRVFLLCLRRGHSVYFCAELIKLGESLKILPCLSVSYLS